MVPRANWRAVGQYHQIGVQAPVGDASPHQLIQMMLDGAVTRVVTARGALAAGEVAVKGEQIGKAIGLIEGLRSSLNRDSGGELAANLEALYDYMNRRLLEAGIRNDPTVLDEVASLLRELQTGWRVMGEALARSGTSP